MRIKESTIRRARSHKGADVKKSAAFTRGALAVLLAVSFLSPQFSMAQVDETKRQSIQSQIEALEREAAELDDSISATQEESRTLERQVKIFNDEIRRRELEIRRLNLAVRQSELDIQAKIASIKELTGRIAANRAALGRNVATMYEYDQENILVVLAKNETLSDFFSSLDNIRNLQAQVEQLVGELKGTKKEFETQKEELEDFRVEQLSLRSLAEVERRAVQEKKTEKDRLLKLTKGKEAVFQQLLAAKKKDIAALKTQLFYIEKTGISAEDALKYAELAARRAGIRTAFLLALLEVETGKQFEGGVITAGTYLGTGNWKTDMYDCYLRLGRRSAAEAQKNAFFAITAKLGLDPDRMPVSRRPSYGWGGALGPAQFIPPTWLLFEHRAPLVSLDPILFSLLLFAFSPHRDLLNQPEAVVFALLQPVGP